MSTTPRFACLAAAILLPLFAHAQSPLPRWQVLAGESSQVVVAGLPGGTSRDLRTPLLGDGGARQLGFYLANPVAERGHWLLRDGAFLRIAQLGSSTTAGPGRNGGEAAHQFLSLGESATDSGPDGQRLFRGRAGDPANTASATHGIWRWNGSHNVEIVRGGSDGPLGPGLGAGWRFDNASDLASARLLPGGAALIHGGVDNGAGSIARVVTRHTPGMGNQACLRSGAAEAGLRPGLAPNDQFISFNDLSLERFVVGTDGRIIAHLPIDSLGGAALFELCDGAPRALAVVGVVGALGPDVGLADTRFISLSTPRPNADGDLLFGATWETASSHQPGLFLHDGLGNRGIAYNEGSGFYSPNWQNARWHSISGESLSVAGGWAAFSAELDNAGPGNPRGVWRLRPGQRPELLALQHASDAAGEAEPGRRWQNFFDLAVLANGDVVLHASTQPGPRDDLWLLSPGQPPRRLLSAGDSVIVPTSQGSVSVAITGFLLPGSGNPENGADGWVARDGQLLARATTAQHGDLLISTGIDLDRVHADGFEPR